MVVKVMCGIVMEYFLSDKKKKNIYCLGTIICCFSKWKHPEEIWILKKVSNPQCVK